MIVYTVDLSAVENISGGLELALDALREAIPQQLMFIQATWMEAVQGRMLPGMARPIHDERYAAAIGDPGSLRYPFNDDEFSGAVICVDGALAGRIEHGFASFDMKPGLLDGPNAKTSKDGGRYNTVPFSYSTPGSTGQKGSVMPEEIHALAKKLVGKQSLQLPAGMQGLGIQTKVPALVNAQAIARGKTAPMTATGYTWRSSPYEGMQRLAKKGHVTYMSFRRVSDKSDANSWIHPGIPSNPVIDAVGDFVSPIVINNLTKAVVEALP